MDQVIEINYISPMSKYKFNHKYDKYYLVFMNSYLTNTVTINKIDLIDIDNVNEKIRSYFVGKVIKIPYSDNLYYSILLFGHNAKSAKLHLLFSNSINIKTDLELNNTTKIELYHPTGVSDFQRISIWSGLADFADEQFYSYETIDKSNKCILFVTRTNGKDTDKPLIKPYIYKFDTLNIKHIYNRYHNCVTKEHQLSSFKKLCKQNTYESYIDFIKMYNIDVHRYLTQTPKKNNNKNNTFKSMFMRKINPSFRKLHVDPYSNNIISCPNDGRLMAFNIDETLKFQILNKEFNFNDLVSKPYELMHKNGFMLRLIPSDYQRVHIPYPASLKELAIYGGNGSPYYISLRFETNYYIPPHVHEREYISVVYGHEIFESRRYPELMDVQPDTRLIYHLILIGNNSVDSVNFTNNKLINIQKNTNINTRTRIQPLSFDQGEELAVFNCCFGNTIFMTNRVINFASDIKFYSKLDDNKILTKPIESYIRLNDVIGEL